MQLFFCEFIELKAIMKDLYQVSSMSDFSYEVDYDLVWAQEQKKSIKILERR